MSFLSLLPIINFDRRPRLVTLSPTEKVPIEITPIALFEDLQETISIMENSSGLRPHQLEWYDKVFLPEYRSKTAEDSRYVRNQLITEKIIAVTTEQLARRTKEVYNRYITGKKILETYLDPLINEGYIDNSGSDLDHRSYIYYPLIDSPKVFDYSIRGQSNNFSHKPRLVVRNITVYPYEPHIISKIEEIFRYSVGKGFQTTIKNNDWNGITPKKLVHKYYNSPEDYFDYQYEPANNDNSSPVNSYSFEYLKEAQVASENGEKSLKVFDRLGIEQSNIIQSPYGSLIQIEHLESGQEYYRCKLHPEIWRTNLTQIEGHCKNEHGGLD
jgi:hypothetical protein